ncbi:hypothetical protein Tco_0241923 [Tanacetum coccineum]
MNSCYTALVASNTRLREKVKCKADYVSELHFEISTLEEKHEKVQQDWHALDQENKHLRSLGDASFEEVRELKGQLAEAEAAARSSDELACTDAKLSDQALVVSDLQNILALERSKSQEYRDTASAAEHRFDDLRSESTHFVGSGVDCLIHKLLSSDEFNATLAYIFYPGITSGVKRGLRMGRTETEFEEASQKVSNFFIGAEAEFNKAVAALPSTNFPFLAKVAAAAEGAFSEVASIQA